MKAFLYYVLGSPPPAGARGGKGVRWSEGSKGGEQGAKGGKGSERYSTLGGAKGERVKGECRWLE